MDTERKLFLSIVAVLIGFGILMVHSASITSRPSEHEQIYLSRHLLFVAVAVAAACVAGLLPARFWYVASPWLFVGTLGLLCLVLVPGIGIRVNGAQRWFRIGSFSLQPSELAKITLPLFLCALAERYRTVVRTWIRGPLIALPVLIIVPLVMLQPDLGTGLFLAMAGAIALFVGGWPLRNFIAGSLVAIPAVAYGIIHKPYQMQRLAGFLAAWTDWEQTPYQLRQSLVTMGAGGWWGAGLGRGFQKLSFLPEANTDFVFAVIGEELGLLGMLSVIALWIGFYAIGLRMTRHIPPDSFASRAAVTLLTQVVLQVALNIAVVTALVPPKGIPHPLISYGGSNLVSSLLSVAVVFGLTRQKQFIQTAESPIDHPHRLAA
jgi:cell division protein FtsW